MHFTNQHFFMYNAVVQTLLFLRALDIILVLQNIQQKVQHSMVFMMKSPLGARGSFWYVEQDWLRPLNKREWMHIYSVSDPDPVGSVSFGRVRILIRNWTRIRIRYPASGSALKRKTAYIRLEEHRTILTLWIHLYYLCLIIIHICITL